MKAIMFWHMGRLAEHHDSPADSPETDMCPACAQVIMHDEGHLAHLASLFNDTKYSDMVLVAEAPWPFREGTPPRRRFHCHRAILASRSSYFDRMFGSGAFPPSGRNRSHVLVSGCLR